MRRLAVPALLLLAAALALAGCKEEQPKPKLTDEQLARLDDKADASTTAIVKERLPGTFAGLVVFRSDAFLYHSAMLDERDIPVINVFGNAAIVGLKGPEALFLVEQPAVRKIRYLCSPPVLARFEPTFEIELLRRYGDNREEDNVSIRVRFREAPKKADEAFVAAAGFAVDSRAGISLSLTGPLSGLPRLLAHDGIAFYEKGAPPPAPR